MSNRVFILLTEGESDECIADAFNECLSPQFTSVPAHGDITVAHINMRRGAWRSSSAESVAGKIRKIIQDESARTHEFEMGDIIAVAQLTDLDGSYVPDSHVVKGPGLRYQTDRIETDRPAAIIRRNNEKRRCMDMLCTWTTIKLAGGRQVPYRLFYNSRNLEHAMHGDAGNLTSEHKHDLSLHLTEHAFSDPAWFRTLVTSEPVLHGLHDYAMSWQWARKGTNSLARGSNIGLLPQEFGLEWNT